MQSRTHRWQRLVVFQVEGCNAGFLGPYGASWVPTPLLSEWAAEGVTLESLWLTDLSLESFCSTLSQAFEVRTAASFGGQTLFLSDDPELCRHAAAQGFARTHAIPLSEGTQPADTVEESRTHAFFQQAAGFLADCDPPRLLWHVFRDMTRHWDAPREVRELFIDDEDSEVARTPILAPPEKPLADEDDPDFLAACMAAYAAQIALLDMALGGYGDALEEGQPDEETLILFLGGPGLHLGSQSRVGYALRTLGSESLHSACIVRPPRGRSGWKRSHRYRSLVPPAELASVITGLGGDPQNPSSASREITARGERQPAEQWVVSEQPDSFALRTPAWFLIAPRLWLDPTQVPDSAATLAENCQLYVKPDDRWDANNVAGRCPQIVLAMLAHCRQTWERGQVPRSGSVPNLSAELWQPPS